MLTWITLALVTSTLWDSTSPLQKAAVQFPKTQAKNVSPDTHLVLTFTQPPTIGAVDFVPSNPKQRVTIFIKSGRYEEIVYFRNKHDITFLGEDRDNVVIGYFAGGFQFSSTVMGVDMDSSALMFIRKRPSLVTAY